MGADISKAPSISILRVQFAWYGSNMKFTSECHAVSILKIHEVGFSETLVSVYQTRYPRHNNSLHCIRTSLLTWNNQISVLPQWYLIWIAAWMYTVPFYRKCHLSFKSSRNSLVLCNKYFRTHGCWHCQSCWGSRLWKTEETHWWSHRMEAWLQQIINKSLDKI